MINTIKNQGNGWLVNGNMSVPNDPRNTDCQEVLAYIADGGIVEDEFTPEELTAQAAAERIQALQSTDADMARVAEDLYEFIVNGTPIPQSVHDKITNRKAKRAAL
jgi:hypothetical protein